MSPTQSTSSTGRGSAGADITPILTFLRVALHVLFAVLLGLGLLRISVDQSLPAGSRWVAWLTGLVLAGVYLFGTVIEHRFATGRLANPSLRRFVSERGALLWLILVMLLWVGLVLHHPDFAWVAFPLYFLQLHVLQQHRLLSYLVVAGSAAVVMTSPLLHHVPYAPAQMLGPTIGAGVAVIFWLIYRALYTQTQAQQAALDELRRTQDQLARSQRAAGRLAERERLARDIHDTLAQGFSSIVLCARALQNTSDEAEHARLLGLIEQTASTNLNESRHLIADLDQSSTGLEDFLAELAQLCAQSTALPDPHRRSAGLDCRFVTDGDPYELDPAQQQLIKRICQASLANVVQHASARTAVVTLGFHPEQVSVDIYDDGVGMAADTPAGFGTRTLEARVAEAGGTVTVESAPDAGTVVAVALPRHGTPGSVPAENERPTP